MYFREPGGMGLPPLETITVFLSGFGTALAGDLLKDAAKSAIKGAIGWAHERIRREPSEQPVAGDPPQERPVVVNLYGPTGGLLKIIEVTGSGIDDRFPHPDVDDE
jgi:hypothetical protein